VTSREDFKMRALADRLLLIVGVPVDAPASRAQRCRPMERRTSGRFFYYPTIAAVMLATLAACNQISEESMFHPRTAVLGGTRQIRDVQPIDGFLPDPSLLQPGNGSGQPVLIYRNPKANFALYNRIILDPVTIWTGPDSALNGVPEDQRQVLANRFHRELYAALNKNCRMVITTLRPGTIHMRVALTDAKSSHIVLNTVASYAPYGVSTLYGVASFVFNNGVGFFAGRASAEVYATDATDGTLLFQAVDRRGGTTPLLPNTLHTWRDVEQAFRDWARRLAGRLQEFGACRA